VTRRSGPTPYAALLRGINLGPRNRIAMSDLRGLVDALGAEDVRTYVQSGNVVFRSPLAAARLEADLAAAVRREFGLDIAVLVRSGTELAKTVAGNPFVAAGADPAKLHVTFLVATPDRARVRALGEDDVAPEELHVAGRTVYLHVPGGYGRAKLTNAFFEKRLAVAATTRNWRTVTALAELTG
jgi:uncharacterized protein (DUF1697 family)